MPSLRKTGLLLVGLVLLPVLLYAAFEVYSLSEDEAIMTAIYDRQLETILYVINQHAWEVTDDLTRAAEDILLNKPDPETALQPLFEKAPSIRAVIIGDTLMRQFRVFSEPEPEEAKRLAAADVRDTLRSIAARLLRQYRLGFRKLEPVYLEASELPARLILMYVAAPEWGDPQIAGLVIDSDQFVNDILAPKLMETGRGQFTLGIFRRDEAEPVYATDAMQTADIRQERTVWLFPDLILGIGTGAASIEQIVHRRFVNGLLLIGALVLVLIVGLWLVYRNLYREMELARMKSEFVSNVSHELRTPLALIRMYAESLELERVPTEAKKREYYRVIGHETERLTGIVNNILHFSRIEAGKKHYSADLVNLNEVVDEVFETYRFHLKQQGFKTELNLEEDLPAIRGDRTALSEAVVNLVDNAIKYSGDERFLAVSTGRENGQVFLEVADHGIGIAPEEQQKVFDQFYRVPTGLVHNTKGTGLGLSLVRHVVHAHGGRIDLHSRLNQGSRFQLWFPLPDSSVT